MKTPTRPLEGPDNPTVDVVAFGPIAAARVDLRPLTIFAGPSNTGKSYLATLIYALHKSFGPHERSMADVFPVPGFDDDHGDDVRHALRDWIATAPDLPEPPPPVVSFMGSALRQRLDLDAFVSINHAFGLTDLADLTLRDETAKTRIELAAPRVPPSPPLRFAMEMTNGRLGTEAEDLARMLVQSWPWTTDLKRLRGAAIRTAVALQESSGETDAYEAALAYMVEVLLEAGRGQILQPFSHPAHYLPAGRAGLMNSHRLLTTRSVQQASRPAPDVVLLSGVAADFLSQLVNLPGRPRDLAHLAGRFEEVVLAGTVRVAPNAADYPDFTYRPEGWEEELPLMRTSSMVSELAPISVYLRYVLRAGDTLLIDEPEAHLHPSRQTRLARLLAEVVHAGVRVVITTHSEWLLEQFANLIRLSALPEDDRQGLGGAQCALEPEQVGVWLFGSGKPGSIVEEVALDQETGLLPVGFDEIGEALYNDGAKIFNRLQAKSDA